MPFGNWIGPGAWPAACSFAGRAPRSGKLRSVRAVFRVAHRPGPWTRWPDRYGLRPEKPRCLRSVFVAVTVGALRTARAGTGR